MTATTPTIDKRYEKVLYQIDIGSGKTDIVAVRSDIVDYFNMGATDVTADTAARTVRRKASAPTVYDGATSNTPRTTSMGDPTVAYVSPTGRNTYTSVRSLNGAKGRRSKPKRCRVPLGKLTQKKSKRTVTIAFPSSALNAAISFFLFAKCTANKPPHFFNEKGSMIPVVARPATLTDINPGQAATTTPTP